MQTDPHLSIEDAWISGLRLTGFGGGADAGGKSPQKDAFPIAVIAHEKVIRPEWALTRTR